MSEKLSIVLGRHGQVRGLRDGTVALDGRELAFVDVERMPDAYRAMARQQPYDICEMAPTSYLMARADGAPITALPLPMTRRFRHTGLQALAGSRLSGPKDIEGARVGLRTYAVTAAVWARGVYASEFGVDLSSVTWLTAQEENVESFRLPPNAHRIPPDATLGAMLKAGKLDAVLGGLAGVGAGFDGELVELVDDAAARERDWYARTGIYPLHGVIVVRDEVLGRDPDMARALFEAFTRAKRNYLARIASGAATGAEDERYRRLGALVGDPLPYGLEENAASLEALVSFAHSQGLIPEAPPIEKLFYDPR
jgi:4,5-dihydroxyphthalate decarboxylase